MEANIVDSSMEGNEIDQDKALQVMPGRENAGLPSDAIQVSENCHLLQANPLTTVLQQAQPVGVNMTSEPAINPKDEVRLAHLVPQRLTVSDVTVQMLTTSLL